MITSMQNCEHNGYGYPKEENNKTSAYRFMWNKFYEQQDMLYKNAEKKTKSNSRFDKQHHFIFDNAMFKKRCAISFDTLLIEAQARGKVLNKQVYVHVVGIGLGVWQCVQHQPTLFMQSFEERLQVLGSKLSNVAVIHFSWFPFDRCGGLTNGGLFEIDSHPNKGFRIFISNRNPADKLVVVIVKNNILKEKKSLICIFYSKNNLRIC